MVDTELHLEVVTGAAFGHRHEASVVDQDVDDRVSSGDLRGGLLGRFLGSEVEFHDLERCIRIARQNLVDIQGNINRVAQTDLINCGRRLVMLLRKQQKLVRLSERLEAEALIELEMLSQLLRQASSVENITSVLSQE